MPGLEGSVVNSERAAPIDLWSVSSSVSVEALLFLPSKEGGLRKCLDEDSNKNALQEHAQPLQKIECGAKVSAESHGN